MTADLQGLIERLEKLEGSDRRLEMEIWLGLKPGRRDTLMQMCENDEGKTILRMCATPHYQHIVPRYTASLDDALKLVPEGWMWDVASSGAAWVMPDHGDTDGQIVIGGIESPAIALTIAALRARQADG